MSDKIFFYVQPENILSKKFKLDKNESHHFLKVLRKSTDTEIWLTDGIGTVYKSNVDNIDNNVVSGIVQDRYRNYGENNFELNLGIGILKRDKMEMVIEKATECGVSNIYPIIMDRSIKRDINIERMNKIALTAIKQCGRSKLPYIHTPIRLVDLLDQDHKLIMAFHEEGNKFADLNIPTEDNTKILVLIGPEGDFSHNEFDLLKENNSIILNLGNRRLRSETAVIVALGRVNQFFK